MSDTLDLEPENDSRPSTYTEGDTIVYRASSIGLCPNALALSRLGFAPSPRSEMLERTAEEGDLHEAAVKKKLESFGLVISKEQEEVEVSVRKGAAPIIVRAHLDAGHVVVPWGQAKAKELLHGYIGKMTDISPGPAILEVKSMSKARFQAWNRKKWGDPQFDSYAWQAAVLMHATGKQLLYAVKCRDDGEMRVYLVTTPPYSMGQIAQRILKVEKVVATGIVPQDCPGGERFFCPFWGYHEGKIEAEEEEVFLTPEVAKAALRWVKAKEEVEQWEREMEEAKGLILAAYPHGGRIQVEDETLVVKKEEDGEQVDTKKLREMAEAAGWEIPTMSRKGRHYVQRVKG